MKTQIQLDGKMEISRFVSLLSLGVCAALKEGAVSMEEAEAYLFNPFTMLTLRSLGIPIKIMDLIHLGNELPDVQSLIPQALPSSIRQIETRSLKALRALPKTRASNVKQWFVGIKRQSAKNSHKRTLP